MLSSENSRWVARRAVYILGRLANIVKRLRANVGVAFVALGIVSERRKRNRVGRLP